MKSKDFCSHHGFNLEPVEQDNGRMLVNVIDQKRLLFPTGKKEGRTPIHPAGLDSWLQKCYDELMDVILEKIYQ